MDMVTPYREAGIYVGPCSSSKTMAYMKGTTDEWVGLAPAGPQLMWYARATVTPSRDLLSTSPSLFVASDDAAYNTGHTLAIDCGR